MKPTPKKIMAMIYNDLAIGMRPTLVAKKYHVNSSIVYNANSRMHRKHREQNLRVRMFNKYKGQKREQEREQEREVSGFIDTIVVDTQVSEDTANAVQIGGGHYKNKPIQPWDAIHAWGLGFFAGNVVKYVARHKDKGGIEDLKKARHYLDKLIEIGGEE